MWIVLYLNILQENSYALKSLGCFCKYKYVENTTA